MSGAVAGRASVIAVAFLIAVLTASCQRGGERVGESAKAPDFTLSDLQGNKVSLAEWRGKVVVIEFWATWCPPCRESVPEVNTLYARFKDKNFRLLAIAVDKGADALSGVRAFVEEQGVSYPVLLDDGEASKSYSVMSIPVLFIVDKEGKVVKRRTGFVPGLAEDLSKEIEVLL